MPQIAQSAIRDCYDAAILVRRGLVLPTEAVRQASLAAGMNTASASDYVYNVRRLLEGRSYTRTMNPEATGLILHWISADFGAEVARTAAEKVLDHVEYYSGLPRGGPQKAVREVAEKFLQGLGLASLESLRAQEATDLAVAVSRSAAEREMRLANADPKPRTMTVTTKVFLRNADVRAAVLVRANGSCEACAKPAPFLKRADGTPYLEVHHRIPLALEGADTVENAIALCPNCHREAHHGLDQEKFRI